MIHQYKLNGYNIVLDVYSGSVHVVDELAYDVIGMYEEHTPEEITALQLQAQDMLTFMEERADMSSSEVSAAYSALQSAISSGSASALRSAIATAQSLLPGSESSVPALETPAPTADIPQEDGSNIYETFPSEDDSNVYE